jgi:parallel beta-helix repeat protein
MVIVGFASSRPHVGCVATHVVCALLAAVAITLLLTARAEAKRPVSVECGEIITVDTKLANDLTDCPEHGLVIGADDVTLDLNGHTIDGDGISELCGPFFCEEHNGVDVSGHHDGVTIRGGQVTDFEVGVLIEGGGHHTVRHLSATGNGHGILVAEASDSRVEGNSANANQAGIFVAGSHNIRIHGNSVSDTTDGAGIPIRGSDHVQITGNSASGNRFEAILLFDHSSDNTIERNSLSDNGDGIVLAEGSDRNFVKDNSASGSGAGVVIFDSNENLVRRNSLRDNIVFGIVVEGSDENRLERNSIFGNGQGPEALGGIYLVANFFDPEDTSDRNVLLRNELSGNAPDGVLVDAGQAGTQIERNQANENADDGIDVDSAATTLTGNTANSNDDLGIEAVPGVIDGGGNRASGNGNPLQCANIFCK